jgi:hypothetical protein
MFRRKSDFNGQAGRKLLVLESDDGSGGGAVTFRKAGRVTEKES